MKTFRLVIVTVSACALLVTQGRAQSSGSALTLGLFERYLDALRVEFGVPGLSVAVVEDGRTWERAFGRADVSANIAASPTTPYAITGLTESIGASLVLYHCVELGRGRLTDRILRWTPFTEPTTTIENLLTHTSPAGQYRYDPGRYSTLGDVAGECAHTEFDTLLADSFSSYAMVDSVPGADAASAPRAANFTSAQVERYSNALRRTAVPYRLDSKGTATRSDYSPASGVSAATGVISTVRDLAQFDSALSNGLLLSPALLAQSWNASGGRSTGLGWFVQSYSGQRIVWQFGLATDAYSSLIVKIPDRRLTLILLANSDRLTNTLNPQAPDVTQSVFARTFLRLFIS